MDVARNAAWSDDSARGGKYAFLLGPDDAALLARLWTRATGHAAERPIRCACCGALHERDALLRIVSPSRDLIAALCDRCAELAARDLSTVDALIDGRGGAGTFCVHRLEDPDGTGLAVLNADCTCERAT